MHEQKKLKEGCSGQKGGCSSVAESRIVAGINAIAESCLFELTADDHCYDAFERGMNAAFTSIEELNAYLLGVNEGLEQRMQFCIPAMPLPKQKGAA